MKTQLLKIEEASKELDVTRQTLYNWKNKGLITFVKSPSGAIFIAVDDLYNKLKLFNEQYGKKSD